MEKKKQMEKMNYSTLVLNALYISLLSNNEIILLICKFDWIVLIVTLLLL
jgi:hypothetical protein